MAWPSICRQNCRQTTSGGGLRVRAIDYNSTVLLLRWDYALTLAEAAQKNPVEKNRGLGMGEVCGNLHAPRSVHPVRRHL